MELARCEEPLGRTAVSEGSRRGGRRVHRGGRMLPRKPSSRATWPFPKPCLFCMNRGNLSRTCETTHDVPSWLKQVETNSSFRAHRCKSCADVYVSDNCCARLT